MRKGGAWLVRGEEGSMVRHTQNRAPGGEALRREGEDLRRLRMHSVNASTHRTDFPTLSPFLPLLAPLPPSLSLSLQPAAFSSPLPPTPPNDRLRSAKAVCVSGNPYSSSKSSTLRLRTLRKHLGGGGQ